MLTFKSLSISLAFGFAALSSGVEGALAFDPSAVFKENEEPRIVLRYGYEALKGGRVDDAIGAFSYGAKNHHVASEWKLARMLELGDGVKADHKTAHNLYSRIVNRYSDKAPTRFEKPYISASLVSLANYALNGIKDVALVNPRQAEHLLLRAAALYQNAEAQYRLGKLYQSDMLGRPRLRSAARWYGLAARKGHVAASANLGRLLVAGNGVPRQPVRGLILLMKAKAMSPNERLVRWYDEALLATSEEELRLANAAMNNETARHRDISKNVKEKSGTN